MPEWFDTSDFATLERAGWSDPRVARNYATGFAEASDMAAPMLARGVGAAPGLEMLDLCSGHGNVARALVLAGAEVTGLDFSPAMLELARASVPEAHFVEGDAKDMPFADAVFDGVACGFGVPHFPDPDAVLAEVRRVLKPGGRLSYSVWSGEGAFSWVFEAITEHGDGPSLPPGPDATLMGRREVAGPALVAAGFGALDITPVASEWMAYDPAAPVDHFAEGAVRGGALLSRQSAEAMVAIREAVATRVKEALGAQGPWHIPMPSLVVTAVAV